MQECLLDFAVGDTAAGAKGQMAVEAEMCSPEVPAEEDAERLPAAEALPPAHGLCGATTGEYGI